MRVILIGFVDGRTYREGGRYSASYPAFEEYRTSCPLRTVAVSSARHTRCDPPVSNFDNQTDWELTRRIGTNACIVPNHLGSHTRRPLTMRVDEIMTEDVATVGVESSVAACARLMLKRGTGSVVVDTDDGPVGIVTESDVLRAGVSSDAPLSSIPTRAVMSHPIKWVRPDSTSRMAAQKMRDGRVKKLVVVDGTKMVGIVTATDIAFHVSDIARGVGEMVELKQKWESDRRFR